MAVVTTTKVKNVEPPKAPEAPLLPIEGVWNIPYNLPSLTAKFTVRNELAIVNNTYSFLHTDGTYIYFPVKVNTTRTGNFMKFITMPPVIKNGYLCVEGNMYEVKVNELIRGKINVTRRIDLSGSKETTTSKTTLIAPDKQQGISYSLGPNVLENANLAYQDQIESLLNFENLKEGEF